MKTVLITGCSSGFGLQMVEDLLNDGHRVVATLRRANERVGLFSGLQSTHGDRLIIKSLDVVNNQERISLKDFIETNLEGQLDVLINNAGAGFFGALEDFSEEQIRDQMELNFFAPVVLIRQFLPLLRKSRGAIINISSIMGQYSTPLGSVYSASKYALEGVTEGLSYELNGFGVSATTVGPGGHRTGFLDSVVWAEKSMESSSPYSSLTNSFVSFMKKLAARPSAPDSGAVSRAVTKLVARHAHGRPLPRSITVGKDAKFVIFLKGLFPNGLYQALMQRSYKMMFKRSSC